MKKVMLICGMFALMGGLVFGGGKAMQSEEVLEELMALTRDSLDKWYGESNPTAFAERFAEKGTYFDAWTGGRLEDGAIKEYILQFVGKVPKLNYEIPNPRVDVDGDTAVLTFNCNAIDPESGAVTGWNVVEVFIRTGTDWKRIHANWNYQNPGNPET